MASGERAAFERVESYFGAFAKRVFYLGASGNGTLAKLVNNQIFLCAGLLLQEGFVLAAKGGLDAKTLLEVVRASSGATYAGLADLTFARSFEQAFFTLALAEKDVSLALESAGALGVPMPVTAAAHETYARAAADGHGAKSFLATLLAIEDAAGAQVAKLSKS
jgi:3-hydroxyisobutyrate dehydrogenase-like beta-hydroxyacid dehydrogenase